MAKTVQEQIIERNLRLRESLKERLTELAAQIVEIETQEGVKIAVNLSIVGGVVDVQGKEVESQDPSIFSYLRGLEGDMEQKHGKPESFEFPMFANTLDLAPQLCIVRSEESHIEQLMTVVQEGQFQRLTGIKAAPWYVIYNGNALYPGVVEMEEDKTVPDDVKKELVEMARKVAERRRMASHRGAVDLVEELQKPESHLMDVPLRGGGSMQVMAIPKQPGESDAEFQKRIGETIEAMIDSADGNNNQHLH